MDPVNTLVIHGECTGTPPTGATYAGIFALECLMTDVAGSGIYEMTGTVASPSWTLISSGATGDQSAIMFQDEGVDLGTLGTVKVENFVGAGVTATRLGDTVTIVIPGGTGGGSAYNLGNGLTFSVLAGTALTITNPGTTIPTGNTGETTVTGMTNATFGSGSDTGTASPYATALTDVAAQYTVLKALIGTAITTPGTFDTRTYTPGIYTTASAITSPNPAVITLNGAGDYVFVSTGGAITFGANTSIVLTNGATASRVFWVANNAITTGSTCTLKGNFLAGPVSAITIGSTNTLEGGLFSKATIVIDGTATTMNLPSGSQGTLGQGTIVSATNATGPSFGLINTSAYTGTGLFPITANNVTTGVVQSISATGLTTGNAQSIVTSSASTSGGTSFEPAVFSTTMTGIGGVGGRVKAYMTTNVALGAWSNALKGQVVYGAAGKTTGLGSAVVAEMTLSAGTTDGTYAPLELELNLGAGALTGSGASLIYGSVNETGGATAFTTGGYLLNLAGLTAGANNVFRTGLTGSTVVSRMTAAIRVRIGSTDYFIPLATATV